MHSDTVRQGGKIGPPWSPTGTTATPSSDTCAAAPGPAGSAAAADEPASSGWTRAESVAACAMTHSTASEGSHSNSGRSISSMLE
eukprot:9493055-Pyramimonas_sp.AAC.1